jgi:muramoyltetrapeptide carboxypeptidase
MKKQIIKPNPLKKGDTIGLVAPATFLAQEQIKRIEIALKEEGYGLKVAENVGQVYGYCAGRDQERAKAFMEMWLDPEVDVIWCGRGGFGSGKLLPYLDFHKIREHPKMLIGMSDVTALHIAVGQEAFLVSYLGPNLSHFFQLKERSTEFTDYYCWDFLQTPSLVHDYTQPDHRASASMKVIREGVGEGPLIGGNLSLITSLIGTPWQLKTEQALLVLEDVHEAPYRIDRMLNQLHLSGMLDGLAGVILGTFEHCLSADPENSLSLDIIFKEYFSHRNYPVLWGFPTGHVADQVVLPLQCQGRLDTGACLVSLLEPAVRSVVAVV